MIRKKVQAFQVLPDFVCHARCIRRLRLHSGKKHLPLNSYVSIYASASDNPEENGLSIVDTIEAGKESNPELMILGEEYTNAFEEELKEKLSKLERKVLYLHLQGMEYLKIAEFMDKSPKTIDNALQRIKAKARQLLEEKRRSEKKVKI